MDIKRETVEELSKRRPEITGSNTQQKSIRRNERTRPAPKMNASERNGKHGSVKS